MTLKEVQDRLKPMNLVAVAEATGVNYYAVVRLANGSTKPQYETVCKIIKWLEEQK